MIDTTTQLEQLTSRAVTLYSRPTVAMELVRLAELPQVDARALKECIAGDPAITSKVLRVVNSSLFGLNRPVADLNQAIGLLGIKPLKLLVLGFSLPDALFAEVAARELEWYWTNTLTRAVAARILCEQLWNQPGDEAFVAGLLQDIGILVLLRELGQPYARFLTGVIDEKCHLASLEHDTLGFDHVQLSAGLLARWQLPERVVEAIAAPKRMTRLARLTTPAGDLPQILHLAELLMQLVGQRRLGVLADLLEAGKVYRGMTKSKLASLVEGLQPQVDQLAGVLSLELTEERDYVAVLVAAQHQMAMLSEELARKSAANDDDRIYSQLLAHTDELTDAMQAFLAGKQSVTKKRGQQSQAHASHYGQHVLRGFVGRKTEPAGDQSVLLQRLVGAANQCRERRQELSLLVVEPSAFDHETDPSGQTAGLLVRRALATACELLDPDNIVLIPMPNQGAAAIVSNCERSGALALARSTIAELAKHTSRAEVGDGHVATTLGIGVASISVVPRNFDPVPVVDSAMRCLAAARACGISAVKSIEV